MRFLTASHPASPWLKAVATVGVVLAVFAVIVRISAPHPLTSLAQFYPRSTVGWVEVKLSPAQAKQGLLTLQMLMQQPDSVPSDWAAWTPLLQIAATVGTPEAALGWFPVISDPLGQPLPLLALSLTPQANAAQIARTFGLEPIQTKPMLYQTSDRRLFLRFVSRSSVLLASPYPETLQSFDLSLAPFEPLTAQPAFQTGLQRLSNQRIGTLYWDQRRWRQWQRSQEKPSAHHFETLEKWDAFQAVFDQAAPVVMGEWRDQPTPHQWTIRLTQPIAFDRIEDLSLRKALAQTLQAQNTFQMPVPSKSEMVFLAVHGLGPYFDLFTQFIASRGDQKILLDWDNQLREVNLSLRESVIGLLDGVVTFRLHPDEAHHLSAAIALHKTPQTLKAWELLARKLSDLGWLQQSSQQAFLQLPAPLEMPLSVDTTGQAIQVLLGQAFPEHAKKTMQRMTQSTMAVGAVAIPTLRSWFQTTGLNTESSEEQRWVSLFLACSPNWHDLTWSNRLRQGQLLEHQLQLTFFPTQPVSRSKKSSK